VAHYLVITDHRLALGSCNRSCHLCLQRMGLDVHATVSHLCIKVHPGYHMVLDAFHQDLAANCCERGPLGIVTHEDLFMTLTIVFY
jgi:hypothetical protein